MKNRATSLILIMIVLLTISIIGCDQFNMGTVVGQPGDPVLFVSASPASGSTITTNTIITVTFDSKPKDVMVSQGSADISGSNAVTLSGPFTLGTLELKLTWADGGNQTLTYTVKSDLDSLPEPPLDSLPEPPLDPLPKLPLDPLPEPPLDPPDPVLFLSANPASGSTIKTDDTITVTFNGKPKNVRVNEGRAEASGSNTITLSGPFVEGELRLKLTWADDGNQMLTYSVEPPLNDNGRLDVGDDVMAQNTVDGNIRGLRIRTGPGLGFKILGKVHDNATGIVTGGSINADGYTWWKVRWNPSINVDCAENPCEGWSAEFVNGEFVLVEK